MNNCNVKYFVTSITNNGTQLVLSFNKQPNIADKSFFRFRFSEGLSLPSGYGTLPVVIVGSAGGVTTPVVVCDKFGDIMTGEEILLNNNGGVCTRYVYRAYLGLLGDAYHVITSNIPKIQRH